MPVIAWTFQYFCSCSVEWKERWVSVFTFKYTTVPKHLKVKKYPKVIYSCDQRLFPASLFRLQCHMILQNHSNMLICAQDFFFQDSLMNKVQNNLIYLKTEIFCSIIMSLLLLWMPLLNKSINFMKGIHASSHITLSPKTGCPLKLAGLSLVSTWMGDLLRKTRLLLEEVLVRPAGGAHPVVCVGPNTPV